MNDDRSTKPKSKIRLLAVITGACVAVIATAVLVYALTMPPSPEEAAESYIEDHYDAVAEAIVQTALPDNPLTQEVIAEVAESIAERVIPYRCDVSKDYRATVEIRCDLSFSLDRPLELRIYAPFQVTVTTTHRDFLGRRTPLVQDANPTLWESSTMPETKSRRSRRHSTTWACGQRGQSRRIDQSRKQSPGGQGDTQQLGL